MSYIKTYSAPQRLLRLRQVLERVPVSKSSWWQGVKDGRYPEPVKLGPRTTAWREADINELIERGTDSESS